MRSLKIPPEISAALGGYLRGQRAVICNVLITLREKLENNYESYNKIRNKEDDRYFDYRLTVLDLEDVWHNFVFVVDDSMA